MSANRLIATLVALFSLAYLFGQTSQNMTLLSNWDPPGLPSAGNVTFNEVWGYVDCNGTEYAIVGSASFFHFIDLSDPSNPVEIDAIAGGNNTVWRDMKTYSKWAYGVCDSCGEGLSVFDLSDLPNSVTMVDQITTSFGRAHNIFIDEQHGRLYAVGTNTRGNGVIIFDLNANPTNPPVIGNVPLAGGYVHDIYVRNHIGYASSGNDGLYIFDFTDPANPVTLGFIDDYVQSGYNHSSWVTDDGNHLVFADETHNRSLKYVDITDPGDMEVEQLFRSALLAPGDTASIAHNPFIRDNYCIVSYYHDGVQVFDISDPNNIVQEAWWDTNPTNTNYNGYNGCWGVYPFLPSGNILGSDTNNGLHVLEPTSFSFTPIGTIPPPPAVSITATGDTELCEGQSVTLNASGGGPIVFWYKDGIELVGTGASFTATEGGNYHVESCNGSPCSVSSNTIFISILTTPDATLNVGSNVNVCEGEEVVVSVSAGADNYIWYQNGNVFPGSSNSVTITEDGNYFVEAYNSSCFATSITTTVLFQPLPDVTLNVSGAQTICESQSIVLSVPPGPFSFQWYKDGNSFSSGTPEITVTEAGNYYVEASNGLCDTESETIEVAVLTYPEVDLNETGVVIICEDEDILLSVADGAETYNWYLDGMGPVGNSYELVAEFSGDYHVIAANGPCESTSEIVSIEMNEYPDVTLNVPALNSICEGEELTLFVASGADNYTWYQNGTIVGDNSDTFVASTEGVYQVVATNGNCESSSGFINLSVNDYPNASLNVPTESEICTGESLFITVESGAQTYNWYFNGSLLPNTNNFISAEAAGDYFVIAANGDCENQSETVSLEVNSYPNVDLNVPLINELCEGESIEMSVEPGAQSYTWYLNGTTIVGGGNSYVASISGSYHVVAANGICSENSETVELNISDYPVVDLNVPLENNICDGGNLEITVPPGAESYVWLFNGNNIGVNLNSIMAEEEGTYQVIASNNDCESFSEMVNVAFDESPDVSLNVPNFNQLCAGDVLTIAIPDGADSYTWYQDGNPIGTNQNFLTVTSSGAYNVIASNSICDSSSDIATVEFDQYPTVDLNVPSFNEICEDQNLLISVTEGAEVYEWFFDGENFENETNEYLANQSGVYKVVAINGICETSSESVSLNVINYPDVELSVPLVNEICDGEELTISIADGAEGYSWFLEGNMIASGEASITVTETGLYHVSASNGNCSANSETVSLEVLEYPDVTLNLPSNNQICEGESLVATIEGGAENYEWYFNGTIINDFSSNNTNTLTISEPGEYYVVASNGECASTSETITLDVVQFPDVSLSIPLNNTICEDESLLLDIANGAENYEWYQDGNLIEEGLPEVTITTAGEYYVVANNSNCVATSETVSLEVLNYPSVALNIPLTNEICEDEMLNIQIPTGAESYQWYMNGTVTDSTENSITTNQTGTYYIIASNGECLSTSETVSLEVISYPNVDLEVALENTLCEGEELPINIAEGAQTYEWYQDGSLIEEGISEIQAQTTGTYQVIASNSTCSAISQEVNLNIVEYPDVFLNVAELNQLCEGESIVIEVASGAESYEWTMDGVPLAFNGNSIELTEAGVYQVIASNGDCSASSNQAEVVVVDFPDAMLSVDLLNTICEGESLEISVPPGAANYQWFYNGDLLNENMANFSAKDPGTYYVVVGSAGCNTTSETVQLEVISLPDVTLNVDEELTVCEGESVLIEIEAGAESYEWYLNNELLATGTAQLEINQAGSYYVIASNADCEETSASVQLLITDYPDASLNVASENVLCDGETLLLSAADGAENYQWYLNDVLVAEGSNEFEANQTGTYHLISSNGNCESNSESISLEIIDFPDVTLNVPLENNICEGETLPIGIAPEASSYQWFYNEEPMGESGNSIMAQDPGVYYVIASNGDCQVVSEMVTVNVNPFPEADVVATSLAICPEQEAYLSTPSLGDSYQWFFNGEPILGANGEEIVVTAAGTYNVLVDLNGCSTLSINVPISMYDPIIPEIEQMGNTLTSSPANHYQWYFNGNLIDGAISQSYEATSSGDYYVEVLDANGCTAFSDPITVVINSIRDINAENALVIYPNPTSDDLFIKWEGETSLLKDRIEVVDVFGRVILTNSLETDKTQVLDLNFLPEGAYFLKLETSDGKFLIKRFIKN